jgi:hypothetical protein
MYPNSLSFYCFHLRLVVESIKELGGALGMSIFTKGLRHEKHMLHLTTTFNYNDIFEQMLCQRFGQNGQVSIKMAMA